MSRLVGGEQSGAVRDRCNTNDFRGLRWWPCNEPATGAQVSGGLWRLIFRRSSWSSGRASRSLARFACAQPGIQRRHRKRPLRHTGTVSAATDGAWMIVHDEVTTRPNKGHTSWTDSWQSSQPNRMGLASLRKPVNGGKSTVVRTERLRAHDQLIGKQVGYCCRILGREVPQPDARAILKRAT